MEHTLLSPAPTRRDLIRHSAALLLASLGKPAFAASDFWNKKQPSEWTNEEIALLTTRSPWAREVNAEFELDTDYTTNGSAGPTIGRGGEIGAPGGGSRGPEQMEIRRTKKSSR